MNSLIKIIISSLLVCFAQTNLLSQDQIIGTWFAEEMDNALIEVYKNKNVYEAKIIQCDEAKYVGEIVLKNFEYQPDDIIWKGKIYSAKRSMEINGTINLESDDELKVVGKKFFMTKTFYWIRK